MIDPSEYDRQVQARRAFEILKDGLGPYLLDAYRDIFGNKWEIEFRDVVRPFKVIDFGSDESILASLDTQGWLDAILKRRKEFTARLGRLGPAYADELLEARNRLAHDGHIAASDVHRVYETVARLLNLISAIDLEEEVKRALPSLQGKPDAFAPLDPCFTTQLMEMLNKTIKELTQDQYRLLEWLRGARRASVSGCAGSGKTLVAIDKAIRLDSAGFSTLVLCHNPFLADYLRHLAALTRIRVFDFAEWIAVLLGKPVQTNSDGTWFHYDEPSEGDLADAFDRLATSAERYDAIIVDEGQDFRETWWLLIEHALRDPANGILYVFHDDNQALLPLRSQYPVEEAPLSMSKNCRNAGAIFDLVRQLHPQAPDTSALLANRGIARKTIFSGYAELDAMGVALRDALTILTPYQLVVLTNEPVAPRDSVLNGLRVTLPPRWRWQDAVTRALVSLARRFLRRVRGSAGPPPALKLPKLSAASWPTPSDILAVTAFARPLSALTPMPPHPPIGVAWRMKDGELILNGVDRPLALLSFFSSEHWVDGLPKPLEVVLGSSSAAGPEVPLIRISTTATFKGLEADGIILFLRKAQHDFEAHVYVGISRARLYLNIVTDTSVLTTIPFVAQLPDSGG